MHIELYLVFFFLVISLFYVKLPVYGINHISIKNTNSINGVRGILASLVAFSHAYKELYINSGNQWIYDKDYFELISFGNQALNTGKIGVAVFFMISGFLFYRLLEKNEINIKDFLKSRFTRIYPLYFSVVIFCAIFCFLFLQYKLNLKYIKEVSQWLVFFGPYKDLPIVKMTHGVEWTLKLEIIFYLTIPILFILFKKAKSNILKHIFIISSILIIFILGFVIRIYLDVYVDPRAALCFYIGYLAIHISKSNFSNLFRSKIATVLSSLFFVSSFFITSYQLFYFYIIFSSGLFFICLACKNNIFGILSSDNFQKLGEISYSIYITHGVVLYLIMYILSIANINIDGFFPTIIFLITFFLITYSVSSFTFKYIEQKFHN